MLENSYKFNKIQNLIIKNIRINIKVKNQLFIRDLLFIYL